MEILVQLSDLVVSCPSVRRLAIDPLLVGARRLVVLDAHIDVALPTGRDAGARLAIRPYPRELEQTATLRDGSQIRLRPIRPEDAPRAAAAVRRASRPRIAAGGMFSSMRELPTTSPPA